jgi:hypothetical protein
MKRELVVVSFALLALMFFVSSVLFLRFNSTTVFNKVQETANMIINRGEKKNFNNSTFIPEKVSLNSLNKCGIEAKADLTTLNVVSKPDPSNTNIERVTFQEIKEGEEKVGSFDIICIDFAKSFEQLLVTLNNANKQDPAIIKNFFGSPLEDVLKLDKKDLYRTFLVKRSQTKECKESEGLKNYRFLQSRVESKLDNKFIECIYNQKDQQGNLLRIVNVDFLFDKDSKFMVQLGNADADKIFDKLLLIPN